MFVDESVKKLPCYMITVYDNPVSEQYYNFVSKAWKHIGLDIIKHKAITPETLPERDIFPFKPNVQKKFLEKGYKKSWTASEKACVYSHFFLWQQCVQNNERMFIFEQDAFPAKPHLIKDYPDREIVFLAPGTAGYIIDPKFAKYWLDLITPQGIVSGMYSLLYHCAFRDKRSIYTIKRGFPILQIVDSNLPVLVDHITGTEAEKDFKGIPLIDDVIYGRTTVDTKSDPLTLLHALMSRADLVPVPIVSTS